MHKGCKRARQLLTCRQGSQRCELLAIAPLCFCGFASRNVRADICRRKQRENKQYSKQVQAEKQKERIRSKKEQINDITKLRKQRVKSGFQGELEFDKDMKQKHKVTPDKAGQRIRQGATAFASSSWFTQRVQPVNIVTSSTCRTSS